MPNIMESSSSASTTSSRLKTSSVSTVYLPSSPINNRNNNHNHNNSITNNNNNEHYSLRVEQNNNFNKPPQFKSAVTRSTSITSSPSSPSSTKTDTISLVDQHSPKLFFKYYSEPNTATNNNNNKLTNSNSFRYSNNNNINYSDNNNRSVGNGDHINPYIVKIQIPEKNRFKTNKSPSPVSPLLLSPIGSPLLSPTSKFNQQQQQQGKGKFIPRVSITSLKSTSSSIEENYPNNTNTNNNSLIKIIENTQQPQSKQQIIVEEMVQKSTINNTNSNNTSSSKNNNDLDVNKAQYLYYTKLTSGQCSPNSDTLDSGTCSDLENTPPPVPKKMSPKFNPQQLSQQQPILNVNGKDIQSSPSHIHNKRNSNNNNTNAINLLENNKINNIKKNNEHFTDSEESESSLSCDSLNVTDLINNNNNFIINNNLKKIPQQMHLHQSISKTVINQHQQKSSPVFTTTSAVSSSINDTKSVINSTTTTSSSISSSSTLSSPVSSSPLNYLPDSLLRDIRDHSNKFHSNGINCDDNINEDGDDDNDNNNNNNNNYGNGNSIIVDDDPQLLILKDNIKKIVNSENQNSVKLNNNINNINNINNNNNTIKSDSNNDNYENDKYYTFHINERLSEVQDNIGNEINFKNNLNQLNNGERKHDPDEETFAGYKDIHSGQSTIRSSKGTIRGVKNRVRNGIVTFLQMQQTNVKNYKEKDAGKVVLYSTSMGIVRDTYAKCANVKQILRTLLIKFEERDVFMSNEYQQEIKERMNSEDLNVPQLYVDGQYIGDAEQVERLNESGELRKMLKPYKCLNASKTCETCGGYRLLPCTSCNGSKKSVHRNHFTAEFVALKCMNCDEVGLVKCNNC